MTLKNALEQYARNNEYPIDKYELLACACGSESFHLFSDDEESGAYVRCLACGLAKDIEESRGYIETERHNVCTCENRDLKIGLGWAFYANTTDVRWVYVGAECPECKLAGVYVDWAER